MILDIVVDVQKDFITGALANPQAQANVAHLAETVKAHARAGHWLFLTRDTHPDNYLATREGRHLPVEHCIEGEDGWNFAPELENALDGTEPEVCHIVNKPTFGSYMLPSEILDELMAHNKAVDDIEKDRHLRLLHRHLCHQQRHGAARGLPGDGNRNPVRLLRRGHAPVPPNGAGRHAGVPVHNRIKRIKAKLKPTHSCVSRCIVLYFTP